MREPRENITITYSEFPQDLLEIVQKTEDLIMKIVKLRDKYKDNKNLPLSIMDTDYENLMVLIGCIEDEVLKFGVPMNVNKQYNAYTKDEIEEIKNNRDMLLESGLDEWIEEGLLD